MTLGTGGAGSRGSFRGMRCRGAVYSCPQVACCGQAAGMTLVADSLRSAWPASTTRARDVGLIAYAIMPVTGGCGWPEGGLQMCTKGCPVACPPSIISVCLEVHVAAAFHMLVAAGLQGLCCCPAPALRLPCVCPAPALRLVVLAGGAEQ
jgi:hypothetical protein